MNILRKYSLLIGLAAVVLVGAGCIVSGTFIIVEDFDFTTRTGFYPYEVDITDEPDWEDHKDKIDFIDLVGLEFTLESDESFDVTFEVFVDEFGSGHATANAARTNGTLIFGPITIGANETRTVTYGESFQYLHNVETLKALTKGGQFDYYGIASGGTISGFGVTEGKVIVTFSASE